jgi:hypothetical protein
MYSSTNSLSPTQSHFNLGSEDQQWNSIFVKSILSEKKLNITLGHLKEIPNENINILNFLNSINIKSFKGSINLESEKNIVMGFKTLTNKGTNKLENIENNYQLFTGLYEINTNKTMIKNKNDVSIQSYEGPIKLSSLQNSRECIDISAQKGGIKMTANDKLLIHSNTSLNIGSSNEMHIGEKSKTLNIGNEESVIDIKGNVTIKGKFIFNDDLHIEKHINVVKKFENFLYLNNNDSDFGFFSSINNKNKGLIYNVSDSCFYFSEDIPELKKSIFPIPNRLADVKMKLLSCDNIDVNYKVSALNLTCKDALKSDKVFTKNISCEKVIANEVNTKDDVIINNIGLKKILSFMCGDTTNVKVITTELIENKNYLLLEPFQSFSMPQVFTKNSKNFALIGYHNTIVGKLRSYSENVYFDNITFHYIEIILSNESSCSFNNCKGNVNIICEGSCTLFVRNSDFENVKLSVSENCTLQSKYSEIVFSEIRVDTFSISGSFSKIKLNTIECKEAFCDEISCVWYLPDGFKFNKK